MTMSVSDLKGTYVLDPAHSRIGFIARHAMVAKVRGSFDEYEGSATFDGHNPASSTLRVTIQTASVDSRDSGRDTHLKSADFFDVEKFPTLTFKSTGVSRTGDDELAVEGDLTIHGATKRVTFTVEGPTAPGKDPWGNTRIGLSATTKINREDFGLTWNAALETGGILVGKDVTITLDVQFVKAA